MKERAEARQEGREGGGGGRDLGEWEKEIAKE